VLTLLADLTPTGAVCLGVSAAGVVALPALLFADATVADFDPRPAVRRAVAATHLGVVHARHDLAWATASTRHHLIPHTAYARHRVYRAREAGRDVAALLILLTSRPEATR
jgi:hypothetical protein